MTSMFRPWAPVPAVAAPSLAYDATGAGYSGVSPGSWTHTATTGAYVLVFIGSPSASTTISSVTYGSSTMTQLGLVTDSNGWRGFVYGLANAPGGSQTVTVTLSAGPNLTANSVSYTGAGSAGTPQTTTGTSTSSGFSQSVTCTSGQMIAQSFQDYYYAALSSVSGGTNRYVHGGVLSINDATASTTFTANVSSGDALSGIAVVLS